MARPVDADSARTYDTIVSAAREAMFAGEDAQIDVSMRKVAELAEVSSGTLSYYFPNKVDLLEACLDAYYERLSALTAELMAEVATARDAPATFIRAAARRLYRFARSERRELSLRVATNAQRGELHPRRQVHVLGPFVGQAALKRVH